jgi:hypothetical protein
MERCAWYSINIFNWDVVESGAKLYIHNPMLLTKVDTYIIHFEGWAVVVVVRFASTCAISDYHH